MFGLQFGDEITALQILSEFLWRIESNYMAAANASQHPPARKAAIRDKKAKGKGHAESLFKAVIRACPSLDWNRRATSLMKKKYVRSACPSACSSNIPKAAWESFKI